MRAIVSVYDKTGLADFATGLLGLGFEVFSTGGTKKALQDARIPVHSVSDITGFPEIMDGRVKTLHPAIHGGILARRDVPAHLTQLQELKIGLIDLVAVNLYPFVQTVSRPGVTLEDALENIDIGGPTMLRASAKNFPHVLVVVDPADYPAVLDSLKKGAVDRAYRRRLAQKAFQHVASYDTAIAQYLYTDEGFAAEMTVALKKQQDLRYGENSHQKAAFYAELGRGNIPEASMVRAAQLGGPELSFNNILDLDSAMTVAADYAAPTVAIIKHNNPCGLASHNDLVTAYQRALAGDPVAAFGGVVAINRPVDPALAREIDRTHYDAIIAPQYSPEALALFKAKKNLRLLALPGMASPPSPEENLLDYRRVRGGLLVQTCDTVRENEHRGKVVTKRAPTAAEMADMAFAWRAVKHIKSNAIVLAKNAALLGMGAGQPSRVVSVELALKRAGKDSAGSVLGSDAFFPFPDGVELAARGGITAIVQPGGSVKDADAVKVADEHNIAMIFTGYRHFKH
ncbi:MAG: bifunctional phosphoribosylaminoimidazolecarboxamide formyltransferase/IMP cyclohydrolase [Chloroflexi bacterium]|nr:bifunctional phosphoribosylaminoimidazolecarboxamide formyltransferase/IMP cyclohydrolase [Chloroflexota bacterium]